MSAIILPIIGLLFVFGIVAVAILWRAFVAAKLWLWFAVPFFHVEPMSIAVAIGLSCLVSTFIHTPSAGGKEKTTKESAWEFASIFLSPLLVLFVGWIALGHV